MSIIDLDQYDEEEQIEPRETNDDTAEEGEGEEMPSERRVLHHERLVDTASQSNEGHGTTRSASFRQSPSSRGSGSRRPSSADLLLAKAAITSPTNPRRATLLGLPLSSINLIDSDEDEELTEDTIAHDNTDTPMHRDADVKQAIFYRSAQRQNNAPNNPGNNNPRRQGNQPQQAKDISSRRSSPPAVAVRGPGARDPTSISFDSEPSSSTMPSMPEALVARVVTSSNPIDASERQRIIESAQLEVWEQIEHMTPRAEVVAVVHSDDSSASSGAPEANPKPSPRQKSKKWLVAIVLVIVVVVVVGAVLILRIERPSQPIPAVVSFLRDISYETRISYPLPTGDPTPTESAADWIVRNFVGADDAESLPFASNMERTSLIQSFVLATLWFQSTLSTSEEEDLIWLDTDACGDDASFCDGFPFECDLENVVCSGNGHIVELHLGRSIGRGTIPKDLALLTRLVYLDLQTNSLVGTIPTELFQLTNIGTLLVSENGLTGSIPNEITNLKTAAHIEMDSNFLRGVIPTEIGQLTFLSVLTLNDNRLAGMLPTELGLLTNLELFDAGENVLTGKIPSEVSAWARIVGLYLYSNNFTGTIAESVKAALGNLEILDLSGNEFTGSLEQAIGRWPFLRDMDISSNEFTGSIPTTIAQLGLLESFQVSGNILDGSLPSAMAQLSMLSFLTVGANFLSGSIPSEFGLLTDMATFDAYFNSLFGSLPTELGSWTAIERFEVEENDLTGVIPVEFSQWDKLVSGLFHGNQFSGEMPLCSSSIEIEDLSVDCNDVTCECCSQCCYPSDDPSCCGKEAVIDDGHDCCDLEEDAHAFCVGQ